MGRIKVFLSAALAGVCVALALAGAMVLGLGASSLAVGAGFADVPESHWAYADVEAAASAGLMNGTGNGAFSPDMKVSAAQFLTLVGRVVFPDVKAEGADWYGPYVSVARNMGLLDGTLVNTDDLGAEITRYDMAAILRAAAGVMGVSDKAASQSDVADYMEIPDRYTQAVLAVYGMGLIRGDQAGRFNGANTMTRAEVAVVVNRLAQVQTQVKPQVIKLGGVGPLTGRAAVFGTAAARGAQIAADEINAANPNGLQLELRYEDDAHDAENSVNAYNALKDWGMQVFLGSVTSFPGVATSVEANNDHMFYLTPSASSIEVPGGVVNPQTGTVDIKRKDNVFQMCFNDFNQGAASAQYIFDRDLGSRVAVIYANDDLYSTGVYLSFDGKAKELGLNVVSVTTFTTDDQTDFSAQLGAAKAAGADLVFLPIYYDAGAVILTQANAMGYAPKWFGVDGMDGILSMDLFDTALAEGVMLLTPFNADAEDARVQSFVEEYLAAYGEVPNQFAAGAYDSVYAIYNALTAAGATADMSASELCDLLIGQFTTMTFDGLTGEGMTWGVDGTVTKSPKGMVIRDGGFVGM